MKALLLPVEPDVKAQGESSSVQQEEATDGDGPPRPDTNGSEQGFQLRDKLRETENQLRQAEKEISELGQENKPAQGPA